MQVKDFQFHKSYFWSETEIKVWHGKVEGLSVYFLEPQNGYKLWLLISSLQNKK